MDASSLPERKRTETIAVISDIHANLEALEAVLARIDMLGVKSIYVLGDMVGYGPDPEACLRITQHRCRLRLMGNHEHAVLNPECASSMNAAARQAVAWTRERLQQANLLDDIASLKPYCLTEDIMFAHGSAQDALHDYLLEVNRNGYSTFDEIVASLENDFDSFRICFVGHNHKPFLATREGFIHPHERLHTFQVAPEEKLYISVGSVGQPRDGDPRASFVTFDGTSVVYHRVEYPFAVTAEKIRAAGLPETLASRLARGR